MTWVDWTLDRYVLAPKPFAQGRHSWLYLARRVGEEASGAWPLVVKQWLPPLSEAPELEPPFREALEGAFQLEHPHLVRIHEAGVERDCGFLVMERLSGVPLSEALPRLHLARGPLPITLVAQVGSVLCRALHAAHTLTDARGRSRGLLHLRLSPREVFLTFGGRVKLLGLGMARLQVEPDPDLPHPPPMDAAVGYMSPEHILGRPTDARGDVFSLGLVLREMLTGERLFLRESTLQTVQALLKAPIPPARESRPDVPAVLEELLGWCLQRDPERRPPDMASVGRALDAFIESQGEPPLGLQLPPLLWPLCERP